MPAVKRKKGGTGCSETDSSEPEDRAPEPKKAFQPFTVSQIERKEVSPSAPSVPSGSTPYPTARLSPVTPIARQPVTENLKFIHPTPRDTPVLEAGLSVKTKGATTIAIDSNEESPELPDSPVVAMRTNDKRRMVESSVDDEPLPPARALSPDVPESKLNEA
ncbi:hypothetical protein RSOLAG22IIIB_09991 [Rhizoctonia solani]|uniref:Uncharacterized protein n=1 Tax=Rhizoctonia solani TaxID=456999 RepID=A0A0K6G0T3_9AGAM|nr:hypothetical protein RSOLAG22IIIB_09991 [Rhizoctonia solani]